MQHDTLLLSLLMWFGKGKIFRVNQITLLLGQGIEINRGKDLHIYTIGAYIMICIVHHGVLHVN